jgi:hypothetical protein
MFNWFKPKTPPKMYLAKKVILEITYHHGTESFSDLINDDNNPEESFNDLIEWYFKSSERMYKFEHKDGEIYLDRNHISRITKYYKTYKQWE